MYSDPVHPRPNPIWDAVPTPRPTPYLWTGLGWTKFRGSVFCGLPPTHALCVVDPPNHAAARALGPAVPEEADLAASEQCAPEGAPHLPCCLVIQTHHAT